MNMKWREFCEYIKRLREIGREMRCQNRDMPCHKFEDIFVIELWFLSKRYTSVQFDVDSVDLRAGIIRDELTKKDINIRELLKEEKKEWRSEAQGLETGQD